MPTLDIEREETTTCKAGSTCVFNQYRNGKDAYDALKMCYKRDNHRLEEDEEGFNEMRLPLDEHLYAFRIEDDSDSNLGVIEADFDSSAIFRIGVLTRRPSIRAMFATKYRPSVERVVERGAIRLSPSDINGRV